jgi:hypothetical protein
MAFVIGRAAKVVDRIRAAGGFGGDVFDQTRRETLLSSHALAGGNAHRPGRNGTDGEAQFAANAVLHPCQSRDARARTLFG